VINLLQRNNLAHLSLDWCSEMTDEILKYTNNINYLSLVGCGNISDVGIGHMVSSYDGNNENYNYCDDLSDSDSSCSTNVLSNHNDYYFFGEKNRDNFLYYLDLSYCPKITNASIKLLADKKIRVSQLKLNENLNITDTIFVDLGTIPTLHTLHLSNCKKIEGTMFKHIENIHTINLHNTIVDEKYLLDLKNAHHVYR
jgi:hypothetical protein